MNDLLRRQAATNATLAKYRNALFDWSRGKTCVHLARFHLRQCGHKPPTIPRIRSALAAKREMKARGWEDVAQMLDSLLPRIPSGYILPGDLAVARSDDGLGAIFVCADVTKFLGWREDADGMVIIDAGLHGLSGVWKV